MHSTWRKGIKMGTLSIILMILIMLVLLLMAGWFAGSETAITNLTPGQIARMRTSGKKNWNFVGRLRKNMDRTLITILVANNVVNIVLSSIAALFANVLFDALGVSLMIGLITFLLISFGEIIPKSVAILDAEKLTLRRARWLYYLSLLMIPVNYVFIWMSRVFISLKKDRPRRSNILVSEQDIKDLVSLGAEEGIIKSIESQIINGVFVFGDKRISDIMVPMKDVFFLDSDMDVIKGKWMISSSGFTRVPFIDEEGKVKGLIYSKDLLGKSDGKISKFIKPTLYIDGSVDVTKAFGMLKDRRIHMAIVTGKDGGHIGIVTLEDMIEEIVGEIYDEYFSHKFEKKN
ncbi:MAG: hemolysin family protein [Thermoplasmatota archaeon]